MQYTLDQHRCITREGAAVQVQRKLMCVGALCLIIERCDGAVSVKT